MRPTTYACRGVSSSGGTTCGVRSVQGQPAARAGCIRRLRHMRAVTAPAAATEAPLADAAASVTYPSEAARKALFSVGREQVTEQPLEVTGTLPPWLSGQLLVNGGGDYSASKHMFDGFGLISKLRFQGGQAWGSQRYLDSNTYRAYKATGKMKYREFAAAPQADSLVEKVQQLFRSLAALATDNANVNLHQVGPSGRQLLATSETLNAAYLIDPDTLDTLQQVQYRDGVKGDLTTAHPAIMPDGSLINFTRTLPFGGFNLFRQDPVTLARTQIGYIPDRRPLSPAWVHDFAATDKYAIIPEWPLYMSLAGLLLDTPCEYIFMNWKQQDGTLIHLVTLDGSQPVRTFKCPSFFAFHFGNAFESADGSMLHVDVAAYDDPTVLNDLKLGPLVSPPPGHQVSQSSYKRLSIPLTPSSNNGPQEIAAPQRLVRDGSPHQEFAEFPAVNPAHAGKQYRYCWCLCAVRPTNWGNAIAKIDTQQGSAITWHRPGAIPGEPRFVARPGATAEDDGVLVVPCMGPDGRSFVAVLDARGLKEVATVQLPYAIPNRFHGIWLSK